MHLSDRSRPNGNPWCPNSIRPMCDMHPLFDKHRRISRRYWLPAGLNFRPVDHLAFGWHSDNWCWVGYLESTVVASSAIADARWSPVKLGLYKRDNRFDQPPDNTWTDIHILLGQAVLAFLQATFRPFPYYTSSSTVVPYLFLSLHSDWWPSLLW